MGRSIHYCECGEEIHDEMEKCIACWNRDNKPARRSLSELGAARGWTKVALTVARTFVLVTAIACLSRAECVTHDWKDATTGIAAVLLYILLSSIQQLGGNEK